MPSDNMGIEYKALHRDLIRAARFFDDAAALAGLGAARVAVVSCDVDNGAKDVKAFVDKGYVVVEVVPVDLFPGSAEVEVLTLLKSP